MSLEKLNSDNYIDKLNALNATLKVDKTHFVFKHGDTDLDEYEILISSCDTAEKLVTWIFHLTEKSWMNIELLRHFIRVASKQSNININ
ncbi:hypothetical protein ACN1OJ_004125 [Providencia stuartii]|uniref:hypothetical protein n=1 Tax=Providencia TaxID=586 RepID=UPI0023499139|nr:MULTISPECIES: hypothetical protein [Providencia]MDN0019603.1 hypothetical protein [Providencia stuartii]